MKNMKTGIYFLFFTVIPVFSGDTWDFQSLAAHAVAHREDLKATQNRVDKAAWQAREAFSHYFPRVDFKGGVQKMGDDVTLDLSKSRIKTTVDTTLPSMTLEISGIEFETGPIDVSVPLDVPLPTDVGLIEADFARASIMVKQPLYTGGRISNARKAAQKLGEVERSGQKILVNEIVSQVFQAYYAYQILMETRAFIEKSKAEVSTFRQVLEIMSESEEPEGEEKQWGLYFLELDEFQLTFKGLELKVDDMMHSTLKWLSFAAGFEEPLAAESLSPSILPVQLDTLDHYLVLARSENPQLQKVRKGIEATEFLVKKEKSERKPIIGIEAFYDRIWDGIAAFPRENAGARLGMTMPLFQGGEVKARVAQKQSRCRELKDLQTFLGQYLQTQTETLYHELENLKTRMELDLEKEKIIEERVSLALFGFKNGMSDFDDYRNAFISRSFAFSEMIGRKKAFLQKKSELIKTLGMKATTVPGAIK